MASKEKLVLPQNVEDDIFMYEAFFETDFPDYMFNSVAEIERAVKKALRTKKPIKIDPNICY